MTTQELSGWASVASMQMQLDAEGRLDWLSVREWLQRALDSLGRDTGRIMAGKYTDTVRSLHSDTMALWSIEGMPDVVDGARVPDFEKYRDRFYRYFWDLAQHPHLEITICDEWLAMGPLAEPDTGYSSLLVGNNIDQPTAPLTAAQIARAIWGKDDKAAKKRALDWMRAGKLPANMHPTIKDHYIVSLPALQLLSQVEGKKLNA